MKTTQQSDVIERVTDNQQHVKAHGKNFKPLVASGSWTISNFHYGRSKCHCCGRPIRHILHLKNESFADAAKMSKMDSEGHPFPETIEIGIVCGPKVFLESCVGFYDDPEREWERQIRSWKDYISYIILCVKNKDIWDRVPEELRTVVDTYLEEGYKQEAHSGKWWIVKDAKKKLLRLRRTPGVMPDPRIVFWSSRTLVHAAKRLNLIPVHWELDDKMQLIKDGSLAQKVCA
jgi:hypothetical protein